MGSSRYDAADYARYAKSTAHYTTKDYTSTSCKAEFDPKKITMRESVKSDLNPHPTPIIVALDVTGSMGILAEAIRKSLGTLFEQVIDRNPVSDPHVMAMAIGDMDCDSAPLQVTQFEADPVTIGKQIEELFLEGGGGGNYHESYLGPLYFAAMKTRCDAFKEGRKGYLFTVGDEERQPVLTKAQIDRFIGGEPKSDLTDEQVLAMVERDWNTFHVMVEEGSHMRHNRDGVLKSWTNFLGQRAIPLKDHTKLAQVVISTIELVNGRDKNAIIKSWDGGTSLVVAHAISGLPAGTAPAGAGPVAL